MKLTWSAIATALAAVTVANAHFQVNYPLVRGPFIDDNEPQFCGQCFFMTICKYESELDASGRTDGYTNPANRTQFPLTNGAIAWNGSHSSWTSKLSSHPLASLYGGPKRIRW